MGVLVSVIIGAIAGWLAGIIMRSKQGGILVNMILGILGGFVGNWIFRILDIQALSGWKGIIITSTIGAILIIAAGRILFRKKPKRR